MNLKLTGNDVKALEDFRRRFDYIWQALEPSDRPSETAVRNHWLERMKHHTKLQLTIDRYRSSSTSSSRRSSKWLYKKLIEAVEIHQLEENSANIENSLSSISTKKEAPANAAKTEKPSKKDAKQTNQPKPEKPEKAQKLDKPSKPEKPSKSDKPADVSTGAAPAKGKGKSAKDGKGKKPKEKN